MMLSTRSPLKKNAGFAHKTPGPDSCGQLWNQVMDDVRSGDVAKSSNVPKFSNGRT